MQLHMLGPAFGLPSIDAECIAAAALLQLHPADGGKVIPTHDLSRPLPRLTDGNEILDGFDSIARRVEKLRETQLAPVSGTDRANATAISSFVRAHGQPLLDISLYVSSENYSTTRSAFTRILPWYINYFLPPKRRADARGRTRHLGISSIDVEDVHEDLSNRPAAFDVGKEPQFEAETHQRANLLLGRKNTVRSLLQRPEHSAIFKLHALADYFFDPLQEILGKRDYFLAADRPTTVDCLVYGYLSLMLYPSLPQDWLAKTMRRKYSKLVQFTERMHEKLGMQTTVDEVVSLAKCRTEEELEQTRKRTSLALPWAAPPATPFLSAAKTVILELASLIPIVRSFEIRIIPAIPPPPKSWQRRYLPAGFAFTATSFGLLLYLAFERGWIEWPTGAAVHIFGRKRFSDYGHLGAALAGISLLSQQATNDVTIHPQNARENPARVEVQVEKDIAP